MRIYVNRLGAAKMLGVKWPTIARWIEAGKLRVVAQVEGSKGLAPLFDRAAVVRLVAARERQARAEAIAAAEGSE